MAKNTNPNDEAATVEAATVEDVAAPGNCSGELKQLPDVEGTTYHEYECQVCHQVVHVGLEDLAEHGLPPEHAPVLV